MVWHPDPLFLLVLDAGLIICPVHTTEEQCVKAHISEEPSVGVRVTEWVDLPSNSRLDPKFLHQEVMANHVIIDHVLILWAGLIMHGPACASHLKLPRTDKLSYFVFLRLTLLCPPHVEEFHLNLNEASLRVLQQGLYHRFDGLPNSCPLDVFGCPFKVLVHRLQPSDIIVRVGNNVNGFKGVDGDRHQG